MLTMANASSCVKPFPATVKFGKKTYKITAVGKKACKGYKKLKSVVIGKYVSNVLDEAFMNCTALTTVDLSSAIECSDWYRTFYSCYKQIFKIIIL